MSQREIQELVEQLEQAADAYHNGEPVMADAEYDALEDELRGLDPGNAFFQRVGAKAPTSKFKKVKHGAPMGSLNKVQTPDEFDAWADDVDDKLDKAEKAGELDKASRTLVVSEKLDGISISLEYVDGKLVRAVTRNDGITGDDITRNVKLMKVPTKARDLTGYVRGEIIVRKSVLAKHFPGYKNPRNTAAGTAKRESDPEPCKHLEILCYQVISNKHDIDRKSVEFKLLEALGFATPFWQVCDGATPENEVQKIYERYVAKARQQLDYDIDGLVIEHDSLAVMEHLGEHDMRPKGARAFKFPHEQQPTRLRDIVWQVGNSGRVTPVAYFETVTLAGASVSQASLHNVDNIRGLAKGCPQGMLGFGDKILVSRRNDVIPYVEKVIKPSANRRFAVPTECPACGTKLTRNAATTVTLPASADDSAEQALAKVMASAAVSVPAGKFLICPNGTRCPAQQSGAVKRWVGKLDIKDWGEALIEALCANGMVATPADLYGLDADELAEVTLPDGGKRVGLSTAKRVLKNLHAKKDLRIADFVGSLGIHLWGRSMTQMIVDGGYDTIEKMEDATVAELAAVAGVGKTKAEAFVDGFGRRKKLIDDLIAAGVTIKKPIVGGKLSGVSFCFTQVRDRDFEGEIQAAGGTVKGSVGKGLTYLVARDPKKMTGKVKKAADLGVEVVTLEQAKALL